MANPFTKPFQRVLDRQNPGEGPYCPIPVNLQGGLTALLAAGASQDIPIRAPKDVVLTNFVISGEHASRFAIGPITVENDNLLGTNGAVPGDMFRPDSKVNKLPNKLARGGRDIVVRVTNISGSDSMFVAALIGDEADTDERAARGR